MKTKAPVMTKASSVKVKNEPKHEALPQKKAPVKQDVANTQNGDGTPAEEINVKEHVKNITERAKQSDQFEYDDAATARQIFDKLPAGEFVIKEGNRTVIQKL